MVGREDEVSAREQILADVRRALGRSVSDRPTPLSTALLRVPQTDRNNYVALFGQNLENLAGKCWVVGDRDRVAPLVGELLGGRQAVASNSEYLEQCGIRRLGGVQSGFTEREALRDACATADFGITSADYALAETGTLVLLSGPEEARLISLLPPVHVAVFPRSRILGNLDELLTVLPDPAARTSAMVLITGPSRTADIEQILVRGVHGPGELYAIIVEDE
jgi:L-lactate dehydrogenase complex protein LldG